LNRPKYVGRLAEAIRVCAPRSEEEWEQYYYEQVPKKHVPSGWRMFGRTMAEHLEEVGRRLFAKISEQLRKEVAEVTEEDCIAYVREVVIHRTYAGYVTEKHTVYEQLEQLLGVKLQPAPDSWDRRYSVDFFYSRWQPLCWHSGETYHVQSNARTAQVATMDAGCS